MTGQAYRRKWTVSGFISELAASQAVLEGWVLYLVPTNALATQVRRDLTSGLRHLEGSSVNAYIGGGEYTELAGERIDGTQTSEVRVMTPEKCALALRTSPEAFASLRLCIFDECHLIAEPGARGVTAELVMGHVMTLAPECRFLILSALVENPEDLARRLEAVTGAETVPIRTPWRPTRTLRGVVGFAYEETRDAWASSRTRLQDLPQNRVNQRFDAPHAALMNLLGAWTDLEAADYALLRLPTSGTLAAHRDRLGTTWAFSVTAEGYVNRTFKP